MEGFSQTSYLAKAFFTYKPVTPAEAGGNSNKIFEKNDAFSFAKKLTKEEAIFGGISTGAALAAVSKKLKNIPEDAVILTFNYDTGKRYLSVEELFDFFS